MDRGRAADLKDSEGGYSLINGSEDVQIGLYDKPLPCFGCGIGWFSFLLGFAFPLMWYYATILYCSNYYRKDPRERTGLATCAIAALVCTVALCITMAVLLLL
ncbi:60S ribosomal protein L18a-like protein isoform X2 [Nymphaea colorata]|uniref:60S ribosomal protein L18a-like protein isoform X2 n=1 Tax=Nymphaea colorata TaxID=210225 RepID=UPI00129D4B1C|nr:60S ribosomal protein L18a-like protein isoform X2 [Nymphaea colorata]XP_031498608.1 60S ribosomal protein L18a-like protein isoform X2 [Nymphaea colorata]XP_031498609.1 60S ribosomal protein L18a-like protein isoform X2 [Nymphaea colorata]